MPSFGPMPGSGTPAVRLLLALDRLQAIRWYPSTQRLRDESAGDENLLKQALASSDANLRRIAVRGLGRFESASLVPTIASYLADADSRVQREAVRAIVQSVIHLKDDDVLPAFDTLKLPLAAASSSSQPSQRTAVFALEQARLEAIARLHYSKEKAQQTLSGLFAIINSRNVAFVLTMLRQNALELTASQVRQLIDLAKPRSAFDLASADALEALIRTGHADKPLILWATQYHCPKDRPPFACADMRKVSVQNLIADDPVMGPFLDVALRDPWPEVRAIALRRVGEAVRRTHRCAPLLDALIDDLAMVKLEALGQINANCEEHEEAVRLVRDATVVPEVSGSPSQGWPLRARAIETLAVLDAAAATEVLERTSSGAAASRDVWHVRAARARAAVTLRDKTRLREYTNDDDPNVRTEALNGLQQLADPFAVDVAMKSLGSDDYQLVTASADVLRNTSAAPREAALVELWFAFNRLTEQTPPRDAARYPRLAILDCMAEWAPPRDNISPVRPYLDDLRTVLRDEDPVVADASSEVIRLLTGVKPASTPTYRRPAQPDEGDFGALPTGALITLDSGESLELTFLRDDAPITVARVARLITAGFYTNQQLAYRGEPLSSVSGGSPAGNDLSGAARFFRDEIGAQRQTAGAVGLLSHGRDTADGRWFISLADQPGVDGEYTIFARAAPRLTEPWPFGSDPPLPVSALVRAGTIITVRLIYR